MFSLVPCRPRQFWMWASPVKVVGKIRQGKFALGSKLPLVTRIARTGQSTRLVNDSKSERRHTVLKYVCGQVKPEPHLHWSPLKLRTRIYMRAARPPVAIVKKGFGSTSSPSYIHTYFMFTRESTCRTKSIQRVRVRYLLVLFIHSDHIKPLAHKHLNCS